MEVYGNIENLKRAIEDGYKAEIRELNKDKAAQIKKDKAESDGAKTLLQQQFKQEIDAKVLEERTMVLNEQKLATKRKFEEAREAMIQTVLEETKKEFPKIAKSSKYIALVKKTAPKQSKIYCGSGLKKNFKGSTEEKGLNGVKCVKNSIIYDMSLDALFEAKESKIREKVIKELWG
ncbi:hypothetical protein CL629_02930 [bacterium]|nr:hypothetical protein [bacterium]|tara:strand:- start:4991 stop:5521 length:531 start_codon:yes stop_codon:yes gene_type:complete